MSASIVTKCVGFVAAVVVVLAGLARGAEETRHVKQIDLVHFSHTDFGFTDHPAVCRELYRRYLDVALDAVMATVGKPAEERFCWTAEATVPVDDWWASASAQRREELLRAVRSGQFDIAALPLNNTPFMNGRQWRTMVNWLPRELWDAVKPSVAVQNDVNGFPRAGAMLLLDRGIRYLFTGINEDSGGVPFARPSAFWWKMPDGRRMFVWLNIGYGSGFDFFEPREWRRGPVPRAADGRYRLPRKGEILSPDEASVRRAHQRCVEQIRRIEAGGYRGDVLTISITNQWRFDNDPPFPPMAEFVATWTRLGLEPKLKMATASEAMRDLERSLGATAPEHEGEWTDWWANGTACAPREVAASRFAKRYLAAAESPVWGTMDDRTRAAVDALYKDLCLFDEHTWGSSMSVSLPWSLDQQGQFNEKARLAWRPMAMSEWILSQRMRSRLVSEEEGLWVANPTAAPYSGWVRMLTTCLREDYRSLEDAATGAKVKLYFDRGMQAWGRPRNPGDLSREDTSATFADNVPNQVARFWVDGIDAHGLRHYRLSKEAVEETRRKAGEGPKVEVDAQGWPIAATWAGMAKPLFSGPAGEFTSIRVDAFAPRWVGQDIWNSRNAKLRQEKLQQVVAEAEEKASVEETPYTTVYTQWVKHPRLRWGVRKLEVWKAEPRAKLTFRLNRISSFDPEIFYIGFQTPCDGTMPVFSSGDRAFVPSGDQLPGSCRDYFAIDGWSHWANGDGDWLWVSRDAPLVSLGGPHPLERVQQATEKSGRILAMVYNNFWYTNFLGDSPGIMEFQFDLVWRKKLNGAEAGNLAGMLADEPAVLINPAGKELPVYVKRLYGSGVEAQ